MGEGALVLHDGRLGYLLSMVRSPRVEATRRVARTGEWCEVLGSEFKR